MQAESQSSEISNKPSENGRFEGLPGNRQAHNPSTTLVFSVEHGSYVAFPKEKPDGFQVYCLCFANGLRYVGCSGQPLKIRLAKHKYEKSASIAAPYLDQLVKIILYPVVPTRREGMRKEQQVANELRNDGFVLINAKHTHQKFKYGLDRSRRHCAICDKMLSVDHFYKDLSRNSLQRRCKSCDVQRKKVARYAEKHGLSKDERLRLFDFLREAKGEFGQAVELLAKWRPSDIKPGWWGEYAANMNRSKKFGPDRIMECSLNVNAANFGER